MSGQIAVDAVQSSRDWVDYATLACTALGVVVVAWYTFITRRQAKLTASALEQTKRSNDATEESNRIAEKGLELGNRAWMVAIDIEPYALAAGPERSLWVKIENLGRIPAAGVILRGFCGIQTSLDAPVGLTPTENVGSQATVGPGRGVQSRIQLGAITEQIAAHIQCGQFPLLAYCEIEYSDWFQRPRKTVACWRYDPASGDWTAAPKYNRVE